jgi:hypothetical protein
MPEEIIRIDCYLAQDCASEPALSDNIKAALRLETEKAEVSFIRVTESEAEKLGLNGSPSVLVNGRDILPASLSGFS